MIDMRYEIVPATWQLARQLVPVMRGVDVQEAWAAAHLSPEEAILRSLEASPNPKVGLVDGEVTCVFGVGEWSAIGLLGVPWLLTAESMPRHARKLLVGSRAYVDEMKRRYLVLTNHVDARNQKAVRWLRWLEFEIGPAKPFGFDKLLFHRFHWEAS